jgi:RNA polymerase sigma-70 factor (sigma-E family)
VGTGGARPASEEVMEQTEDRSAVMQPAEVLRAASFEDLYVAEYGAMVKLAFLLVGTGAAEEVVQDAFAKVYERWGTVDRPGAYLRTCVVNGCRQLARRRRLQWRHSYPAPAVGELGADHLLEALDRLPASRRAAIVLRYYCDLSEAEIAATLGVRPGTVKSMVHRGLRELREVIER